MTGKILDANFEYATSAPWWTDARSVGSTIVEFGSSAPPPKRTNPKEIGSPCHSPAPGKWVGRVLSDDGPPALVDRIPEVRFFSARRLRDGGRSAARRFSPATVFLDLGEVRELADVRINDVPAAWRGKCRTAGRHRAAEAGRNAIRIDVSTLINTCSACPLGLLRRRSALPDRRVSRVVRKSFRKNRCERLLVRRHPHT